MDASTSLKGAENAIEQTAKGPNLTPTISDLVRGIQHANRNHRKGGTSAEQSGKQNAIRWLLIGCDLGVGAEAQLVKREGVWRNAYDCPNGRKQERKIVAPGHPCSQRIPVALEQLIGRRASAVAISQATAERDLKAVQEMVDKMKTPKPLTFKPNAPGCGTGPGMPKC